MIPDDSPRAVQAAYDLVSEWLREVSALGSALSLMSWDRETLMAPGSTEGRAPVMASLAGIAHRALVRADVEPALVALEELPDCAPALTSALREVRRRRTRADRLSEDFVRRLSEVQTIASATWIEARPANDFAGYAAALTPLVALKREEAERLEVGDEPYDGLLDDYEPGARAAWVEPVLSDLRSRLVPLLGEIPQTDRTQIPGEWPAEGQIALAHAIAGAVGFNIDRGVIAISAHPFSSRVHALDVRLTTRASDDSPLECVLATLHECGHALYDQSIPPDFEGLPIEEPPSMGAHESQARFWENHVGRTRAFWSWVMPLVEQHLPAGAAHVDADVLFRAVTQVRSSPIRTESDEVTYNLHILLRFELELALIRGTLSVKDLPEAWSAGMSDLLGITPPSDTNGVMQDIHWPEGLFGYFPTYTLGNLYAAQLADAFEREHGPLETKIAAGDFARILGFLRERVHIHGGALPTAELMHLATGSPLTSDAFIGHVRRRYLPGT